MLAFSNMSGSDAWLWLFTLVKPLNNVGQIGSLPITLFHLPLHWLMKISTGLLATYALGDLLYFFTGVQEPLELVF